MCPARHGIATCALVAKQEYGRRSESTRFDQCLLYSSMLAHLTLTHTKYKITEYSGELHGHKNDGDIIILDFGGYIVTEFKYLVSEKKITSHMTLEKSGNFFFFKILNEEEKSTHSIYVISK